MDVPGQADVLEVTALAVEIRRVRRWVTALALQAGLSARGVTDVALAVTEAVTNAVMHAFPDRDPGTVRIEVRRSAAHLRVDVCDDGVGMRVRDDSPGAGFGRLLMTTLADEVVEQPRPGGGTHVVLRFDVRDGAEP